MLPSLTDKHSARANQIVVDTSIQLPTMASCHIPDQTRLDLNDDKGKWSCQNTGVPDYALSSHDPFHCDGKSNSPRTFNASLLPNDGHRKQMALTTPLPFPHDYKTPAYRQYNVTRRKPHFHHSPRRVALKSPIVGMCESISGKPAVLLPLTIENVPIPSLPTA